MKKWIKAARLRTLPLSVSGIIIGTACAYSLYHSQVNFYIVFILCLLTTLFLQVLSNYANDYGDAKKGTDNEHRVGPARAIQSGEISPSQMKTAIYITAVLALISALAVIYAAFGTTHFVQALAYFILGMLCVYAAIKYTVGANAYGYRGLGDIFVFVFFGWVSTFGSYYLYGQTFRWDVFFPATALGLLSMAVLNMNNMRDVENDAVMGKNTMVVQMGFQKAKYYHFVLVISAMISFLIFALLNNFEWFLYFFIIGFIPLFINLKKVAQAFLPKTLDSELKRVSLSTFLITILFAVAILLNQ